MTKSRFNGLRCDWCATNNPHQLHSLYHLRWYCDPCRRAMMGLKAERPPRLDLLGKAADIMSAGNEIRGLAGLGSLHMLPDMADSFATDEDGVFDITRWAAYHEAKALLEDQ